MKNTSIQEKIKERILSSGYGKFDLVEDILTKDEILNQKPRIVLKNIAERLSFPEEKINRKTFWSWLRRYKEANKPANRNRDIYKQGGETIFNPELEKEHQEWIKNFKPTIPESRKGEPVIIKVIKSDTNSQL